MVRNASPGVVGISARNPHYFQYKGKEVLLITSAEHYGAVISKNFDYIAYFDALAEYGLNYTRIYPGAFVECAGKWLPEDNMAPGADLIVPWARSGAPGYHGGGNKFDLDRWDPEYFARLRDFLEQADKRGIIVEICFFNAQYKDFWEYSPLHKNANIQGIGGGAPNDYQTLDDAALVGEQMKYIEKLMRETNDHDNVIYEFIDEPTLFLTPSQKAFQWISALIDKAVEVESGLPKQHMLAQQLELGIDFCDDDRVAIITTQYIQMSSRQVGGVPALDNCYCYNKPIELNETFYINSWKKDGLIPPSRIEAWEFMVGGGAGFNQLNGFFVVPDPSGSNEVNRRILQGLKNLRAFMEGFDFAAMTRDARSIRSISTGAKVNMISAPGKQYAIYMHHSFPCVSGYGGTYYEPNYGKYAPDISIKLDAGAYDVEFIEPETLVTLRRASVISMGDEVTITCPEYTLDIAIKITAAPTP